MLDFDGERFIPGHAECVREIWLEHWHRYVFAAMLAQDKQVLDIACGEGYGSALLSKGARSVVGVDISAEAVAHAQSRYGSLQKVRFVQGDAGEIPVPDKSIDLAVSFETVEHISNQQVFLNELQRVLKDDGVLVMSSPDKAVYSDVADHHNPFHTHEMYREEFESYLKSSFKSVHVFEQALVFQSMIWRGQGKQAGPVQAETQRLSSWQVDRGLHYPAPFLVAVCARSENHLLQDLVNLHCFGDAEQSYQQHYNAAVSELIQFQKWGQIANQQLQHKQQEIERLEQENQQLRAQLRQIVSSD